MSVRSAFAARLKDDEYTVAEDESLGNRGVLGELTDEADARDRRDLMACRGQLAECQKRLKVQAKEIRRCEDANAACKQRLATREKENEQLMILIGKVRWDRDEWKKQFENLQAEYATCKAARNACEQEFAVCKAAKEARERELAQCRAQLDQCLKQCGTG